MNLVTQLVTQMIILSNLPLYLISLCVVSLEFYDFKVSMTIEDIFLIGNVSI